MLTDDAGAVVGRAFYDAYGGVIESTIPLTLTSRLYEGRPFDAATELVYHGGGRYYDPQLGQRLQPDPSGGPPLLPQSLNRYAAPPAGSVVGQAARTSFLDAVASFMREGSIDAGVDYAAKLAGDYLADPAFNALWGRVAPRVGHLEVTANSALIKRYHTAIGRKTFEPIGKQGRHTRFRSMNLVEESPVEFRAIERGLKDQVKDPVRWGVSDFEFIEDISQRGRLGHFLYGENQAWIGKGKWTGADMIGSSVVGFVFDTGLEYARLANNPYLTSRQRRGRAVIVGLTGVGYGVAVILTVGTGGTAFAVSLILGWTFEKWTADAITGLFPGLQEQRRLQPLP
jgi:RHS repeat-associated protein